MKYVTHFFILVSVALALIAPALVAGFKRGDDRVRQEAVKAGAAEWVPGPDGRPEFKWRNPDTAAKP